MRWILILTMALMSACATSSEDTEEKPVRDLSRMTLILDLHPDGTLKGFNYPFRVCNKKFLGFCRDWKLVHMFFDGKDSQIMQKLKAMDFVLKQRVKP